jgi:hypothetical protein
LSGVDAGEVSDGLDPGSFEESRGGHAHSLVQGERRLTGGALERFRGDSGPGRNRRQPFPAHGAVESLGCRNP